MQLPPSGPRPSRLEAGHVAGDLSHSPVAHAVQIPVQDLAIFGAALCPPPEPEANQARGSVRPEPKPNSGSVCLPQLESSGGKASGAVETQVLL